MPSSKKSLELLDILRRRGWTVEPSTNTAPLLPDSVAARYPVLPGAVLEFLSSFDRCSSPDDRIWFLTRTSYSQECQDELGWNAIEMMALDFCDDASENATVRRFWDIHFPFMIAVHSDYDYLAIRLSEDEFGAVVHGFAPEWEEPSVVATSFTDFLDLLASTATAASADYPLRVFLDSDSATQISRSIP